MKIKIIQSFKYLGLATISGLLGAFGGADKTSKAWRRIGIPVLITLIAVFRLWNLWSLTIMSMSLFLSMGHGIPSKWDEGSKLGKLYFKLAIKFVNNQTKQLLLANIMTRATIAIGYCVSLISVVILKQNWTIYGAISTVIISTFALLSWRDLGGFIFKGKNLLWSEFVPYTILGLGAIILIG